MLGSRALRRLSKFFGICLGYFNTCWKYIEDITSESLRVLLFLFLWFSCASISSSRAAKGLPTEVQSSSCLIQHCETQNLGFSNLPSGTLLLTSLWVSLKLNLLVSLPVTLCHEMIHFSFWVVHIFYACVTTHIYKPTYMHIISLSKFSLPKEPPPKKNHLAGKIFMIHDQVLVIIK